MTRYHDFGRVKVWFCLVSKFDRLSQFRLRWVLDCCHLEVFVDVCVLAVVLFHWGLSLLLFWLNFDPDQDRHRCCLLETCCYCNFRAECHHTCCQHNEDAVVYFRANTDVLPWFYHIFVTALIWKDLRGEPVCLQSDLLSWSHCIDPLILRWGGLWPLKISLIHGKLIQPFFFLYLLDVWFCCLCVVIPHNMLLMESL